MTRPPEREPTRTELVNRICETAYVLARKWKLVTPDGGVVCMRQGCGEPATLPALLCRTHLAAMRRAVR